MVETRACEFCGDDIEPGTGLMLVANDGGRHHFCSSKCESNAELGRSPRDVEWAGQEAGQAEQAETEVEADTAIAGDDEESAAEEAAEPEPEPETEPEPEPEPEPELDEDEGPDEDETADGPDEQAEEADEGADEGAAEDADDEGDEAEEAAEPEEAAEDEAEETDASDDEAEAETAEDAGDEEAEEADEPADDAGAIPDDLEALEYRELQELAKDHDIAANQSTEDLVEQLAEVRDGE